jgi:hypothetical protein
VYEFGGSRKQNKNPTETKEKPNGGKTKMVETAHIT